MSIEDNHPGGGREEQERRGSACIRVEGGGRCAARGVGEAGVVIRTEPAASQGPKREEAHTWRHESQSSKSWQ